MLRHRPLYQIANSKRGADLAWVRVPAQEADGGMAAQHVEPPVARKQANHVLGKAVAEVVRVWLVAEVAKRQYRHRWPMRYRGRPLVHIDSRICPARFSKRCRRFHDPTDEPKTPPVDRLDERLPVAVVANRLPGSIDPAAESRLRYDPPVPDRVEQIVLTDNALRIADQIKQQVVDLRLDVYRLTIPKQLPTVRVDLMSGKSELHAVPHVHVSGAKTAFRFDK